MNSSQKGNLLVFIAVVLWSLAGVIIKTVDASAVWITFARSIIGGIFLLPFIVKEKIYPLKRVLFAGIFMAIFSLSLTITTKLSSSAMAISMQYSAPMYVIAFSFYKNKKINAHKLIVLIFIFVGVLLNVVDGLRTANLLSTVSGLVIGISFVLYSYNLQKIQTGSSLGIVSLINFICAFFYLFALPFDFTPVPSSLKDILLLCFAGTLISGVSYALYGSGLRKTTMETALIIALAEPILNPIWVYVATKELPSVLTIIGLVFILLGAIADVVFKKYNLSVNANGQG